MGDGEEGARVLAREEKEASKGPSVREAGRERESAGESQGTFFHFVKSEPFFFISFRFLVSSPSMPARAHSN